VLAKPAAKAPPEPFSKWRRETESKAKAAEAGVVRRFMADIPKQ